MLQVIADFGVWKLLGLHLAPRIYGYGLMLVLGFISGIFLAQWRARRMGENPESVTMCGILALLGGIVGARAAYIIEQWHDFMSRSNPLAYMLDVTSGGLIYYGGVVLATGAVLVYLWTKHLPARRYLDIIAVSLMVGLGFGRAGCYLNGCCYGARCSETWAFGSRFPMFSKPLINLAGTGNPFSGASESPSPVYSHQFGGGSSPRLVQPDARLLCSIPTSWTVRDGQPLLNTRGSFQERICPPRDLHGPLANDQLAVMFGSKEDARARFESLSGGWARINEDQWRAGLKQPNGFLRGSEKWEEAAAFSSSGDGRLNFDDAWAYLQFARQRIVGRFGSPGATDLTGDQRQAANQYLQADLFSLASAARALPVKPAQLVSMLDAFVLAGLLAAFFRLRTRDGQVFALLLVLYPIGRFVEESIRDDNRHDLLRFVLTHNQYTSIVLLMIGVVLWLVLRKLPASAGPIWAQGQAMLTTSSGNQGTCEPASRRS